VDTEAKFSVTATEFVNFQKTREPCCLIILLENIRLLYSGINRRVRGYWKAAAKLLPRWKAECRNIYRMTNHRQRFMTEKQQYIMLISIFIVVTAV